jgi:hypothetical protein
MDNTDINAIDDSKAYAEFIALINRQKLTRREQNNRTIKEAIIKSEK